MIYIYHFLSLEVFFLYYQEKILSTNQTDIRPVWFGYETCKPHHHSSPGKRSYWLIHYIISGKGRFLVNDREYALSGGHIFIISPENTVSYEADGEDPWFYTWIAFDSDNPLPFQGSDVIFLPEASSIFTEMRLSKKMINGKESFLCAKIWELFSLIMEGNNDSMDHVEKALRILHAEYMTKITVEQVAERLHLEKSYFSHVFKRRMDLSPKQYLTKLRMEQALSLMQHHKYSVTEAAAAVGYESIFLFSKMFKRYFGIAPTKYAP